MTPEEHKMLVETHEVALENSRLLAQIHRTNKIALGVKIFYWVMIIGISFGAFYFVQPYIDSLKEAYSGLSGF